MVQCPGWERPEQRGCCGVLVSRCPCSGMWGRRAKFGVLEHHLLAYSPRRSQRGLGASLHHGQDCGGGIAESRERLLEKLQGLLWASMREWSKGKETKLTPFAAIRTSTEVGWVSWRRGWWWLLPHSREGLFGQAHYPSKDFGSFQYSDFAGHLLGIIVRG